jgi:hypothetical protein
MYSNGRSPIAKENNVDSMVTMMEMEMRRKLQSTPKSQTRPVVVVEIN